MTATTMANGMIDTILLAQDAGFWLPAQGSTTAQAVDTVFHVILGVSVFFFVLIVVLMAVFVIRYRRRPGDEAATGPTHSTSLELLWSGIPVAIVLGIFYLSFMAYMDMKTAPADPYEIQVTGQMWSWQFRYPNGAVSPELHVPLDRPVLLTMTSQDVVHSLFVPRFRVKMDLVPGRYTQAWFRAVIPGEHDLYCAEYCGRGHSDMLSKVVVHEAGQFEDWVQKAANIIGTMPDDEAGKQIFNNNGCAQCHAVEPGKMAAGGGPNLVGIFGETHRFRGGTSAVVDENYLRESILEPNAKVREGFQAVMPVFKGRLTDDEIRVIIQYIKSLSGKE